LLILQLSSGLVSDSSSEDAIKSRLNSQWSTNAGVVVSVSTYKYLDREEYRLQTCSLFRTQNAKGQNSTAIALARFLTLITS